MDYPFWAFDDSKDEVVGTCPFVAKDLPLTCGLSTALSWSSREDGLEFDFLKMSIPYLGERETKGGPSCR